MAKHTPHKTVVGSGNSAAKGKSSGPQTCSKRSNCPGAFGKTGGTKINFPGAGASGKKGK